MGDDVRQRMWALLESGKYVQTNIGLEKGSFRRGASRYADQHGQSGLDILESRTLEGS